MSNAKTATTASMRITADVADALLGAMRSPAWAAATGDEWTRLGLLLEALCGAIGGRRTALPDLPSLRTTLDVVARDLAIEDAFDGSNYAALADTHGISRRQVRRIVEEVRARRRRERRAESV